MSTGTTNPTQVEEAVQKTKVSTQTQMACSLVHADKTYTFTDDVSSDSVMLEK